MDAFLGEIRAFPYNFAPRGWQLCSGQLLSISQWSALFSLIGTYYGGNGTSTFALPNLQGFTLTSAGQTAWGSTYVLGEAVGTENVSLLTTEIPMHTHGFNGATGGGASRVATPDNTSYLSNFENAGGTSVKGYVAGSPNTTLSPMAISAAGGSQPHPNQSPYLVMGYYIAMEGIYPARN